jgi:hypothetical protein
MPRTESPIILFGLLTVTVCLMALALGVIESLSQVSTLFLMVPFMLGLEVSSMGPNVEVPVVWMAAVIVRL